MYLKNYKNKIDCHFTNGFQNSMSSQFMIFEFSKVQVYVEDNKEFFKYLGEKEGEDLSNNDFFRFIINEYHKISRNQILNYIQKVFFDDWVLYIIQSEDNFVFKMYRLKERFDINLKGELTLDVTKNESYKFKKKFSHELLNVL